MSYEPFAPIYGRWSAETTADVPFHVEPAREADGRRRVFERVAASLRPGGRFAWNAFAFDQAIAARLDGQRQEDPVPHTLRYSVGDNRVGYGREPFGDESREYVSIARRS